MKKALFSVLFSSVVASAAYAAPYTQIDSSKSRVEFGYRQMGVGMQGHFKRVQAQLQLDPAQLQSAKAQIDIDLNSIDTGSAEANQEVAGKAWFDSKTYPTARFISKEVKAVGPQQYQVSGTLTIKGRSQPIIAAATLTPQGNQALIKGKFRFKRSDFAIGEGVWASFETVANEIDVQFQFLAK